MPKITFKKAFFRIFWKILAKTGSQSLYLCGFPEASVEMEVAPFRALTQSSLSRSTSSSLFVEMEVAPFRALTLFRYFQISHLGLQRRNGGRPFQGIDTLQAVGTVFGIDVQVEMEVAPFRALTQYTS